MVRKRTVEGFTWSGIVWQSKVDTGNAVYDVAIEALEQEIEIVQDLAPIALNFGEFWETNKGPIIASVKRFIAQHDEQAARRCRVESVCEAELGWNISLRRGPDGRAPYFELYLEFKDDAGSVLGEDVCVKVAQVLSPTLEISVSSLDLQIVQL